MKNKLVIAGIAIVIIAAVTGLIFAGLKLHEKEKNEEEHLISLSFQELQEKIDNKETFILVRTQSKCSHCAEYKPVLKEVLAKYDIYAYEIEEDKISNDEKKQLDNIAKISGTPTTIFFVDGEEKSTANRIIGPAERSKIINRFKAMGYIK